MKKKHAYLIMAHHRPELLNELLCAIDDPRNDIYLHIDKKSCDDMGPELFKTSFSKLTLLPSISVHWGGYSQVECELNLLSAAISDCHHSYYHLLTGSTYPLRSQDDIHDFFMTNEGSEFINIVEEDYSHRVRYYWFIERIARAGMDTFLGKTRDRFIDFQRFCGIDRFSKYNMECKKGLAYWSITEGLAMHLIQNRELIYKMMRHTYCGDEVFVQTIAYNSPFKERICNNSLRMTTWPIEKQYYRPSHSFTLNDIRRILSSDDQFALKFEGDNGLDLIKFIRNVKWNQ